MASVELRTHVVADQQERMALDTEQPLSVSYFQSPADNPRDLCNGGRWSALDWHTRRLSSEWPERGDHEAYQISIFRPRHPDYSSTDLVSHFTTRCCDTISPRMSGENTKAEKVLHPGVVRPESLLLVWVTGAEY
jgi:hypothetical protein